MNRIKTLNVTKIRFYHPTPDATEGLRGTEVSVTVGVKNEDLPSLAQSADAAKQWIEQNIQPYKNHVFFSLIVLGDSVLSQKTTTAVNVSVQVPSSYLPTSHLPSDSEFTRESLVAPPMINIFPDDQCWQYKRNCSIDFATFETMSSVPMHVDVAITSGWSFWARPPLGTTSNAHNNYNYNYMQQYNAHLAEGRPKKPKAYLDGYIYQFLDDHEYDKDDAKYGLFDSSLRS
uniref:Uncharacterized protein n=1 Tax=Kalanchoe fedtschenkoi TaxID=63787 RepID=A0A7N1A9P7_KALFE